MARRSQSAFPSPPLKFRTAGFPQYGFKADISDGAFPMTRFASTLSAAPDITSNPALCRGGLPVSSTVVQAFHAFTPEALAQVRVVLSRSVNT